MLDPESCQQRETIHKQRPFLMIASDLREYRAVLGFLPTAILVLLTGCTDREPLEPFIPGARSALLEIELQRSNGFHSADVFALGLHYTTQSGESLAGIQGYLRFDPSAVEYVGQQLGGSSLVLVNGKDSAEGELRILSVNVGGLPYRSAVLTFRSRCPTCDAAFSYELEVAETRNSEPIWEGTVREGLIDTPDLAVPTNPRMLTIDDWAKHLAPGLVADTVQSLQRVPGEYLLALVYGDAYSDGVINVLDEFLVSNISVGNMSLIEGSDDPSYDAVVAGNPIPFNSPGLGEAGDDLAPGVEANGTRQINVLDVTAIGRESVGIDVAVVGEPIPGRGPVPTDRVVLSGDITDDRTLFNDTIYELQGTVQVYNYATLTVEAGTRIEGERDTFGSLVIHRGANIVAAGTSLLPIVFTCDITVPDRGCWGGVTINGFAPLNNYTPPWTGGAFEKTRDGTGTYGGNLVEDSSGVLRYVRIERAGRYFSFGRMPGLSLMGVGSNTVIENVQVHRSSGDGIFVSGGKADMRNIVLTDNGDAANGGAALRWDDGWGGNSFLPGSEVAGGRVQFLIVRQDAAGQSALRGSNSPQDPNDSPRSIPQIYNATIIGRATSTDTTVVLERGTGAALMNSIVIGSGGPGLDVDGAETCGLLGIAEGIRVEHSIFFGNNPDFTIGPLDCDVSAYALDSARVNRVIDPQIVAPFAGRTADLRLVWDSPALSDALLPPSDGFFDVAASFVGAVPAANTTGSNIPWFSGWTRWGTEYY